MRHFVPEICSVKYRSRKKGGPKFDVFVPQIWESAPYFGGHCKSTPLLSLSSMLMHKKDQKIN